jgi:hypothetical protein
MSYDPYASGPDEPRSDDPYDYDRPSSGDPDRIKGRVQAPAIALIVVGVLNLLFALYMILNSVLSTVTPAEKLKAQQMQIYEALPPALKQDAANKSAEEMKMQAMLINWPLTLFALLASILPIVGGIRMMSLKSYALAVCGALSVVVPCMSVTACCGAGEVVGIWALVVLLNAEVKAAFH